MAKDKSTKSDDYLQDLKALKTKLEMIENAASVKLPKINFEKSTDGK